MQDLNKFDQDRVFEAFFEWAPTALVVTNQTGQIIRINRQTERLFGFTRNELAYEPLETLIPERFRNHHPRHRLEFYSNPRIRAMGERKELSGRHKQGGEFPVEIVLIPVEVAGQKYVLAVVTDISVRKQMESERDDLMRQLGRSLQEAKLLRGLVPICSYCKKIRDDDGSWRQTEEYVSEHVEITFSHGICPDCVAKYSL